VSKNRGLREISGPKKEKVMSKFNDKFVPVHVMQAYKGSRDIDPLILNLGTI